MGLAITFGILTLIGIALYIYKNRNSPEWKWSVWYTNSIGGIFPRVLGALFIACFAGAIGSFLALLPDQTENLPYYCTISHSQSLKILRSGDGTSGQFYLGSGYINSYLSYFYYTQDSDGAIIGNSLMANQVKIYQDDSRNPRIESYTYHLSGWWGFFFIATHGCTSIIHIPPGSINNNYQVG